MTALEPEVRCTAGQTTFPTDCNRHSAHYWCRWCAGYYGVPHDGGGCHMQPDPATRANPGQCACRFCKTWNDGPGGVGPGSGFGHAQALRGKRLKYPVPEPEQRCLGCGSTVVQVGMAGVAPDVCAACGLKVGETPPDPRVCPTCGSTKPDEDGDWDYDEEPAGCADTWHDTYVGTCACGKAGVQLVHGQPWCGDEQ